jgi:hypothetical protein
MIPKSKSRNVNRYVRWVVKARQAREALTRAQVQASLALGKMTGAQMAEAEKILREV